MPIALSDEHRELAQVATGFLTSRDALGAARALLDADKEGLPGFWDELVSMGWLGLHLPEQYGGSGYGLMELSVVIEALGAASAPGPFLPTVITSAIIDALGSDAQRERHLPGFANGSTLGAVALQGVCSMDVNGHLAGDTGLVLGGAHATTLVVRLGDDLAIVPAYQMSAVPVDGIDPTRRVVRFDTTNVMVDEGDMIVGGAAAAMAIARSLAAAEAAGGASAALTMALEYAKVREQFGRTIGSFQAVKHHLANMLVDVELAAAVVWDAARAGGHGAQGHLAGAVAAAQAMPAFRRCAEKNIQTPRWHRLHLGARRPPLPPARVGADGAVRRWRRDRRAGAHAERGHGERGHRPARGGRGVPRRGTGVQAALRRAARG